MATVLPRRSMQLAARVVVLLMLCAQTLVAAHACSPQERSARLAAAAKERAIPCHQQARADIGACLNHCSAADQSLDTPHILVLAMPAAALLTVPLAVAGAGLRFRATPPDAPAVDPPIPIRFQVFRT